jgi:hypothetical protein
LGWNESAKENEDSDLFQQAPPLTGQRFFLSDFASVIKGPTDLVRRRAFDYLQNLRKRNRALVTLDKGDKAR